MVEDKRISYACVSWSRAEHNRSEVGGENRPLTPLMSVRVMNVRDCIDKYRMYT